jgi:hypothetical protein
MANIEPIFKSVGQALFVAFTMEITGASPRGTMESVRYLLEERYGNEPTLKSERTLDLGGLTALEFRAECARIRKCVDDRLAYFERDAIWARFAHLDRKEAGINGLHAYYLPTYTIRSEGATLALMRAIYKPGSRRRVPPQDPIGRGIREHRKQARTRDEWSLRGVELEFGISRSTLQRQQVAMRELTGKLELLAQGKLETYFVQNNLIGDPN